ncbi:MAG: hypothetical protein MK138_03115 [Planctomycetes bacterium]|nr:hypothetical protein [Planctomycetota bacterium]
MTSKSRLVALLSVILLALFASSAQPLSAQQVDFAKEVYPVLESNCFKCHGEKKAKAKLKLHTSADVLKGGKSGKVIEPGKSAESLIIKRLSLHKDDEDIMPPKGGPLEKEQIEAISRWIDQGAKWADGVGSSFAQEKPGAAASSGRQGGIAWFGTLKSALVEAARTGRPILLISAAPHCHNISGLW